MAAPQVVSAPVVLVVDDDPVVRQVTCRTL
jgi:CheY-like chemotaxis protein